MNNLIEQIRNLIINTSESNRSALVYKSVEEATLALDALINRAGFEVKVSTLEELITDAETVISEANEEMTSEMEEDFQNAIAKMKESLSNLKIHMAKIRARI